MSFSLFVFEKKLLDLASWAAIICKWERNFAVFRLHEALEIIRSDLRMEKNLAKLEKKKKNELKAALGKK